MTALVVGRPEYYTPRAKLVRIKYENSTRYEYMINPTWATAYWRAVPSSRWFTYVSEGDFWCLKLSPAKKRGGHAYGRRNLQLSNTAEEGELCLYAGHSHW